MPGQVCVNCRLKKSNVKLCGDDLLCTECSAENERQLAAQRTTKSAVQSNMTSVNLKKVGSSSAAGKLASSASSATTSAMSATSPVVADAKTDSNDAKRKKKNKRVADQVSALLSSSTPSPLSQQGTMSKNDDDFSTLRLLVQQQQQTITSLKSQLDFVLSFLGITNTTAAADGINDDERQLANDNEPKKLFSDVISSKSTHSFEQAVLTTVSTEALRKQARQNNIIVTGVPQGNQTNDADFVKELLSAEFNIPADNVARCDRLGPLRPGKLQLTRVRLTRNIDAEHVISHAKQLRQSSNIYVRQHVYINKDLTKTEAAAAYELRCQRRRKHDGVDSSNHDHRNASTPTRHLPIDFGPQVQTGRQQQQQQKE